MSLKTWKEEFYAIPVQELSPLSTDEELLQHSLQKWKGALPKNLNKHGVTYGYHILRDHEHKTFVHFATSTCSLCEKYHQDDENPCAYTSLKKPHEKVMCPIFRKKHHCCSAVYARSRCTPRPMIALLKDVLTAIEEEKTS